MRSLKKLIEEDLDNKRDLNCAERIIYGANDAYNLGLSKDALLLSAGFGGGMGIESVCGALTGAAMALGKLAVKDRGHESTKIKDLTKDLFTEFKQEMESIECAPLKNKYRTEKDKCNNIILKAAEVLDNIYAREFLNQG